MGVSACANGSQSIAEIRIPLYSLCQQPYRELKPDVQVVVEGYDPALVTEVP